MWTVEELEQIDITLAQKLLPFPANSQQIEDLIGNTILSPSAIPVSETERLMMSALTMSFYARQKQSITLQEIDVLPKIEQYSVSASEAVMNMCVSVRLPAICVITIKGSEKIMVINPRLLLVKTLIYDSGLMTKQLIKPKLEDLVVVPNKKFSRIQYVDVKDNHTLKTIEIPDRVSTLMVNTITDTFITLPIHITKQKIKIWFQSTQGRYKV